MSDRTTFRLPGHDLHPLAERKCLLSLLAAYSRQWNPRNLEYPWYEPWAQILAALVAEHPSYSVAPQPYLWYDSSRASKPHTTPGPDHLMANEDEEYDEPMDDVGNMTLDSIRSISIPSHRDCAHIPDFAITRKVSFPRSDNNSHFSHLSRRVTYVGFPLLAELKPCGPRSDNIQTSLFNARRHMIFACKQLGLKQAFHLFQMYPHQDSVILMAVTGFWWSYSISSRRQTENRGPGLDGEGDEDDEDDQFEMPDTSFDDQDGIHQLLAQDASSSDNEAAKALQDQLRAYGFALDNLGDTSAKDVRFQTILPEGKVKLVQRGWLNYLLYGTAPSNQVLSLIHDRLRDVVYYFYRGERG